MTKMNTKSSKLQALGHAAREAGIEALKMIPSLGILIEGVRAYYESMEEQQSKELIDELLKRKVEISKHGNWYQSDIGQLFLKKAVASALNAEYADKIEFFANAIANGPLLKADNARRLKFVEIIRHVSRPAMQVLLAAIRYPTGTEQIMPGQLAEKLGWSPELVDSCVSELYGLGVLSSTKSWGLSRTPNGANEYRASTKFAPGIPAVTAFSKEFAAFISAPKQST